MRIAVIQLAAGPDWSENLDRAVRLTGDTRADLLVLPEAVMHDFGPVGMPLGPAAQSLDGPFVAALGELARKRGTVVLAGMFERSDDHDRPFNTLVAVGPDGAVLATYRKTHLYDSFGYRESDRLRAAAPSAVAFQAGDRTFGLMTCYDLRFPEHSRALVDAGADVLVVPAAWVRGPLKEDQWFTLLRARAIENTSYVVAAAQCGRQYCGRSAIIDPMGVPVAALGETDGVAVAEVAAERLADVRARNPALSHRRWTVSPSGHPAG